MEVSRGEKAKDGAKTAISGLVILAGLGMCGTVFYTVFRLDLIHFGSYEYIFFITRELFSSNSANSLFDKAVADCLAHEKLADMLGEPVKAFGESRILMLALILYCTRRGGKSETSKNSCCSKTLY